MRNLFYELIEEAKDGKVIIGDIEWPIGFNTQIYKYSSVVRKCINENNISCLIIKDEDFFFDTLEKYISRELEVNRKCINFFKDKEKNVVKTLMAYLFVNATTEDFLNPIEYMRRCIDFLDDNTFDYLNEKAYFDLGDNFFCSKLCIKNSFQSIMMETPKKIELSIVKGDNLDIEYRLPTISYGFSDDKKGNKTCYIYSLLNPKEKKNMTEEEIKFNKKIGRVLYKINAGVVGGEDEFTDVSQVSPSAVLSLMIFLSLLSNEDIHDIKAVPYLPLRYLSRDIMAKLDDGNDELIERNKRIQDNVTNRFIRTFLRASYHLSDSDVTLFPYQLDEFLHFKLGNNLDTQNNLLNSAVDGVSVKK